VRKSHKIKDLPVNFLPSGKDREGCKGRQWHPKAAEKNSTGGTGGHAKTATRGGKGSSQDQRRIPEGTRAELVRTQILSAERKKLPWGSWGGPDGWLGAPARSIRGGASTDRRKSPSIRAKRKKWNKNTVFVWEKLIQFKDNKKKVNSRKVFSHLTKTVHPDANRRQGRAWASTKTR